MKNKNLLLFLVSLCALGFTTNPAFRTDKNTVALWNFDEKNEKVIESDSEDAISLTLQEDASGELATPFVDGKFGRALQFSGTSWAESAQGVAGLEDEITVEAWIRINDDAFGKAMGIVENMDYTNNGFRMAIWRDGRLIFMVESPGKETSVSSADPIPTGEWVHVAGTYNGATISVFVNGELSGHVPLTDGILSAEDQTLRVGFGSAEEHMIFSGEIDALRISNVIRDIKK